MKKSIAALALFGIIALSVCGCGNRGEKEQEHTGNIENEAGRKEESLGEDMQEQAEAAEGQEHILSFSEFKNLKFCFSSGAGGWATEMTIDADGSFSGAYYDGELGSWGDDYPNGTMYRCDFSGQFSEPLWVNDYTFSMHISELNYAEEPGKEEIKDGMRYCYSTVYGLDDAEDILIYLPGTPLAELPEEFRSWVGYYDLSNTSDTELPFYGLYNEASQCGFSSYDIIDSLKESIAFTEDWADSLVNSIKNDPLTQTEYNEKTKELYDLWDSALNQVWNVLKQTQGEERMRLLTEEEREWIALKEQTIAEAGTEYEGGSMQSMVMNQKAAEMTKARVYELMAYIQD